MQNFNRKKIESSKHNIEMDLKWILCEEEGLFHQNQDTAQLWALVNTVIERVAVSSQAEYLSVAGSPLYPEDGGDTFLRNVD
jgi:hypothetical protein